jgi:cell wall-associated NlpC family hydrolase
VAKHLASRTQFRRAAVLTAVLASAAGYAGYAGTGAGAAPQPSISQVQAKVNNLQGQVDQIGQRWDSAQQQYTAAQSRLTSVTKQVNAAQAKYNAASAALVAVAVAQYENANGSSVLGLLTSGDPTAVLGQASLVLQVEGTHNAQAVRFLTLARELSSIQAQRKRTAEGVTQLKTQLAKQKTSLVGLLKKQQAELDSLTVAQQTAVATVGTAPSGTATATPVSYTGPTTSQADKAVAFAYAQLGKPYVWGATGPGAYDCSGLVQAAWAAAGVSIPRTTEEQWAALPQVPLSNLEPGDLILYNGESHVSMYVGNGYIIDAPHTGAYVERLPLNTSWYAGTEDGAVRP